MPRQSTVYDLTSLRIHPDGTRVNKPKKRKKIIAAALNPDAKWIATDAGGSTSRITRSAKRNKISSAVEYVTEDFTDEVNNVAEELEAEVVEASPNSSEPRKEGIRAQKRRRFNEDVSYLEQKSPAGDRFDLPSSDLLKNIHYLAAQHYHTLGQLYNEAQAVRKLYNDQEKSKSKRKKKATATEKKPPPSGKYYTKEQRRKGYDATARTWPPDMYKAFDGSALMCFGILIQEYVRWQLKSRLPEGLEEQILSFTSGDESTESEIESSDDEDTSEDDHEGSLSHENDHDDAEEEEDEDNYEDPDSEGAEIDSDAGEEQQLEVEDDIGDTGDASSEEESSEEDESRQHTDSDHEPLLKPVPGSDPSGSSEEEESSDF